jgi:hypothetical protein
MYVYIYYSDIEVPTRFTCYRVYFYLTIALHVSGIIITHLQEHKTTVTTASGNPYTVQLSVAIVEELEWFECVVGGVPDAVVNSCFVLLKMGDNDTRNM